MVAGVANPFWLLQLFLSKTVLIVMRLKTRDRPETKSSSGSFSYLLAIVVFSIVAIIVYQPVLANGVVAIICGIGAGLIAGKLWKAIQAIVGILGALYVAGFFIGSYGG